MRLITHTEQYRNLEDSGKSESTGHRSEFLLLWAGNRETSNRARSASQGSQYRLGGGNNIQTFSVPEVFD
jgi:hypothetical protein